MPLSSRDVPVKRLREKSSGSSGNADPDGTHAEFAAMRPTGAPTRTPRQKRLLPIGLVETALEPKYLATACIPRAYCISRLKSRTAESSTQTSRRIREEKSATEADELSINVVESCTSLSITLADLGTERVPPHTWLVLDSSLAEDAESNTEISLCGPTGGGIIPAESRKLLSKVSKSRLHAAAAEANFQRAQNGTSMIALRHAALIAGLIGQKAQDSLDVERDKHIQLPLGAREATLMDTYEGSTFTLLAGVTVHVIKSDARGTHVLTEAGLRRVVPTNYLRMKVPSTWCTNEFEAMERARRLEPVIMANAAAASNRADLAMLKRSLEGFSCTSSMNLKEGPGAQRSSIFGSTGRTAAYGSSKGVGKSIMKKGHDTLLEFNEFTRRRIGNPVRTWFQLDPEENLRIGEKQFMRRCEEIGFRGNLPSLWRYIDADQTGSITILELDAPAAIVLADFKNLIASHFGNTTAAFKFFDFNKSGRIAKPEFLMQMRELGYQGNAGKLHALLDRSGLGIVHTADIAFLDKWHPVPYLFAEYNWKGLQRLKDALVFQHASLLKAWRKALDKDSTMRISWDEFSQACMAIPQAREQLPSQYLEDLPQTSDEIAGCWRALDQDCSGWIALREFDQPSFHALASFKRWADESHGGVVAAFRNLDTANAKLSEAELKKASRGEKGYKGDFELLFDGLDVNNANQLTENDVKFLDAWDLDWEDWEYESKMHRKKTMKKLYSREFQS